MVLDQGYGRIDTCWSMGVINSALRRSIKPLVEEEWCNKWPVKRQCLHVSPFQDISLRNSVLSTFP